MGVVVDRRLRYFSAGTEYLDDLAGGEHPELLGTYFRARIEECATSFRHDDVFTVGAFDDVAHEVSAGAAFALIDEAVLLAMGEKDSELFELTIALLLTLVRTSATTELPLQLEDAWDELDSAVRLCLDGHSGGPEGTLELLWSEIARHYRR